MKRKNEIDNMDDLKREKSDPDSTHGIGGDHPAWDIIIGRLDYASQMKLSQQNQNLAEIVEANAESKLRKFRRQIQEDKYMYVIIKRSLDRVWSYFFSGRRCTNPENWCFYRALIWTFEEQSAIRTRYQKLIQ